MKRIGSCRGEEGVGFQGMWIVHPDEQPSNVNLWLVDPGELFAFASHAGFLRVS